MGKKSRDLAVTMVTTENKKYGVLKALLYLTMIRTQTIEDVLFTWR